jgi:hypothetical protein
VKLLRKEIYFYRAAIISTHPVVLEFAWLISEWGAKFMEKPINATPVGGEKGQGSDASPDAPSEIKYQTT